MKKILTLIVCALAFKLCVLGQSLHFDGVNDYVELENTLAGTYSGLTIEGWVNIEQYPDGGQEKILDFGGPESRITLITNADGSLLFGIEGNNTSVDGMANTYDIPTGEWVHLAGVWNGVDSINIFMNGEMLNSNYIEPSIDTLTIWNGTKLFLGARYSQQEYFHGAIESLSFWDRPLSNFEIGQLLNCPPQVGDFGLRAFWPFEEGLGQVTEGINCEACDGDIFGASWSAIVSGSRIQGCASPEACNYNPEASCDDGSCIYPPVIDLGDDIETCEDSVLLDAGPGFDSYLWSTGDTTQTLTVLESGEISVQGIQDTQFSLDFAGEEQNITIPEIPEYEADSHTISVWCKPAGFSNYDLVSKDDESNNRQWLLQITSQGKFQGHVWTGDDDLTEIQSSTVMESGQWYYLTQTWDGELFKTYINGNLEGDKVAQGPLQTGDHPITIGGDDLAPNFWTNGLLDDVEIWDIALNEEAIQSFMICGPEGDEDGLVGLWRFNEGEGSSVYDMSIHGNHGDVNGIQRSNDIPETICTGQCSSSATIAVNILGQGCTAPEACNYNPTASCDDGSCIYPPVIDLGDDIETCEDSVLLDAGPGFDSYMWSTGDTSQVILAESSGTYLVDAEVLSDWTWVTGEPLFLDYWTADQSTPNAGCAEMYSSDGFHIAPCNEQKHFVMEIDGLTIEEESFSLPEIEGFTYIDPSFMNNCNAELNQVLTSAYFMSDAEATFGEAHQTSESHGGHLVDISSPYENDFVANIDGCLFGCGNNCEGFWIGLELKTCAVQDSISVDFEIKGCTDPDACNFDEEAVCDDGNCATCEALQGACGPGTTWDPETSQCVIEEPCGWNPDSDDDSLVGVSDLLMFLSVFGSEWPVFNCGDPVLYQGYEYETVQIGEQCWFAENLRSENYSNGDTIPNNLSQADWSSTTEGAVGVSGESGTECEESYSPILDGCNPLDVLSSYGRHYNWFATNDARGLCPNGWHVPAIDEWDLLTTNVGEAGFQDAEGYALKSETGWHQSGNGLDFFDFNGEPAGYRDVTLGFRNVGSHGWWWSSSAVEEEAMFQGLAFNADIVSNEFFEKRTALSIRCIKD